MTTPFAPTSDHAQRLASEAASKAETAKFAKGLAVGKSDLFRYNPFAIIVVDGFNSRDFTLPENEEHVDDLARSIAAEGVKKPIEVRFNGEGQPELVDGECRLRATIRAINTYGAEIESIPAILSPKGQNDADRVASQFTSNSGKRFNELEAAQTVRKLLGYGWDERKIAERGCMSPAKVARLVRVLEMPEEITGMVREGKVAVTQALDTLRDEANSEKAIAALKAGFEVAADAGSAKVTAKHIAKRDGASASPKAALSALRDVFAQADVAKNSDGTVTYTVTEAGGALVRTHLGV